MIHIILVYRLQLSTYMEAGMRCAEMSGLQQISRLGGYLNGGKRSINGHLHNIIVVLLISKLNTNGAYSENIKLMILSH